MANDTELRSHFGGLEIRDDEASDIIEMDGYAAVFDSLSSDLGGFREMIKPGAFSRAMDEGHDVVFRWAHGKDHGIPMARTKSGTLTLTQDAKGLRFLANLPRTERVRELREAVKRGDVDGVSFAFRVDAEGQHVYRDTDGQVIREIRDVALLSDVSPVVTPAYSAPSVELREALTALADEDPATKATPAAAEEPQVTEEANPGPSLELYEMRLRNRERA